MTCAFALRVASAFIVPATAPAPPMSHFMSSMPAGGLRLMPPVSKVTPLPTKAVGGPSGAPSPFQDRTSSCASRSEPWLTPSSAPIPASAISASPSTSMPTPSASSSRAWATKLSG